ncbi:hypothetical protein [Bradyrhizobium sp. NAS80.1]|nr:hypothetical protein [Bradyrhizobium sp. NAS80.1]
MRLTDEIKHFIASPVMIIVGTRDAANRPSIGAALAPVSRATTASK